MAPGEAGQPPGVHRLDRTGMARPHHGRRRRRRARRAAGDEGGIGTRRLADPVLKRLTTLTGHESGHSHGAHAVHEAIEVQHEQEQAEGHAQGGEAHAEVRDRLGLDLPDDCERERQGPDQLREQELEHPVPVPQPHVARRERPRRHLDAEDGHGDDEARQRGSRADGRGEHRRRRLRGVPVDRQHAAGIETEPDLGEDQPGQRADEGDDPQAASDVLTNPERDAPAHGRPLSDIDEHLDLKVGLGDRLQPAGRRTAATGVPCASAAPPRDRRSARRSRPPRPSRGPR